MNFPRKISLLLLFIVALSTLARIFRCELPTLRWFFSFTPASGETDNPALMENIYGATMLSLLLLAAIGLWIYGKNFEWNPITLRRFKGFRSIQRGYYSFILLISLLLFAMLDQIIVGKEALVVRYQGTWYFPAFVRDKPLFDFQKSTLQQLDYRALRAQFASETSTTNFVIMPLIPWDSTLDTQDLEKKSIILENGTYHPENDPTPYQGLATAYHPAAPSVKKIEATFRKGRPHGDALFFDPAGNPTGQRTYEHGQPTPSSDPAPQLIPPDAAFYQIQYAPTPPNAKTGHLLGTDARGWDVAAQLYGGLQVIIKASILYVFLTFAIGITIGLASGYFGGIFDLITQRLLEILQNMPFLLIVMIIAARVGRENVSIITIVTILCLFSWIGISQYKRTAALKEKARDYVAAARVMGAGTIRILFLHILPNVLSTSITLVPFTVTAVATSLTALDFIGFGLPDKYPSWGTLLDNGLNNLEAPWIVSSVFTMLFLILLIITFIGEAIREAFDPKKFTTYQ